MPTNPALTPFTAAQLNGISAGMEPPPLTNDQLSDIGAGEVPSPLSSSEISSIDPSASRLESLDLTPVSSGSVVTYNGASVNDKRVRLSMLSGSPSIFYRDSNNALLQILNDTNGVIFPYQPSVAISYSSNYETQAPPYSNFVFHSYKNSEIKSIDISGEFSVRTPYEGQYVISAIHFLRCLTMMFTGNDSSVGTGKINLAGAPPLVVSLTGMGFGGLDYLPVVVTNVTTTYPDNVDYVSVALPGLSNEITKVPTQMTIAISVLPVFSRSYASRFGVQDFSMGTTRLLGPLPNLVNPPTGQTAAYLASAQAGKGQLTYAYNTGTSTNPTFQANETVESNSGALATVETQADTSLSDITIG